MKNSSVIEFKDFVLSFSKWCNLKSQSNPEFCLINRPELEFIIVGVIRYKKKKNEFSMNDNLLQNKNEINLRSIGPITIV